MAALTCDQIVDRVRSICARDPFRLTEADSWLSFDYQPSQNVDAVFRIPPPSSQGVLGGFGFYEDRTDSLQIWVARKHQNDFDGTRRWLLREIHSLTAAITRDGAEDGGDYVVLDEGRGSAVVADPTKEYVMLRLTLPVNYETQL